MDFTVIAEGGTFEYSSLGNAANLYRASGDQEPMTLPERDGFEAELAYFVECCKAGKRPEFCPPEESAAAVKLTLLMLEARKRDGEKLGCRI